MKKLYPIAFASLIALGACGGGGKDQIDRMGRPGINTVLNNTFTADEDRASAEDAYNSTDNADSVEEYKSVFAKSLAIYDALYDEGADNNGCGDNAVTNRKTTGSDTTLATGSTRYDLLAGVLADDQLYINSAAGGTCNTYLAAELAVLGQSTTGDCGGRTPSMDVIATSYTALATGLALGLDDGVADPGSSSATFPFLGAAR